MAHRSSLQLVNNCGPWKNVKQYFPRILMLLISLVYKLFIINHETFLFLKNSFKICIFRDQLSASYKKQFLKLKDTGYKLRDFNASRDFSISCFQIFINYLFLLFYNKTYINLYAIIYSLVPRNNTVVARDLNTSN